MKLNFCRLGGFLVNADSWLPTNDFDHEEGSVQPPVGCNNLHCTSCKKRVRNITGYSISIPNESGNAEVARKLYQASNPTDTAILTENAAGDARLYFCSCHFVTVDRYYQLDPLDPFLFERGEKIPWSCNGHPPVGKEPLVNGLEISSQEKVNEFAEKVISGENPDLELVPGTVVSPEAFILSRIYQFLPPKSPERKWFDRLMISFLQSEDALRILIACIHLHAFPNCDIASEMVPIWEKHHEKYVNLPHPYAEREVKSSFMPQVKLLIFHFQLALLANASICPGKEIVELVKELIINGKMKAFWSDLAPQIGEDWINANMEEIFRANPEINLEPIIKSQLHKEPLDLRATVEKLRNYGVLDQREFDKLIPYAIKKRLK